MTSRAVEVRVLGVIERQGALPSFIPHRQTEALHNAQWGHVTGPVTACAVLHRLLDVVARETLRVPHHCRGFEGRGRRMAVRAGHVGVGRVARYRLMTRLARHLPVGIVGEGPTDPEIGAKGDRSWIDPRQGPGLERVRQLDS
jgi:hypothetical protein